MNPALAVAVVAGTWGAQLEVAVGLPLGASWQLMLADPLKLPTPIPAANMVPLAIKGNWAVYLLHQTTSACNF